MCDEMVFLRRPRRNTSLRATMMRLVKEQETVKNVSTRDGSILAWLTSGGRPVVISSPDWKRMKLEHLF